MLVKRFKRLLPLTLAFAMLIGGQTVFASKSIPKNDLQSGYEEIANKAHAYGIPFSMTFEEYVTAYDESGFITTQEYADAYLGIMKPTVSTYSNSGGSSKWYYNIGTTLPDNADPKYDKYDLYNTVKKGDIIFEANGGYGITGHIAIVEGKYYSAAKNVNYIRIIEAISSDGVVRTTIILYLNYNYNNLNL